MQKPKEKMHTYLGSWVVSRFSIFLKTWKNIPLGTQRGSPGVEKSSKIASAENVEFQHFSNFKTRFSSQWPENPTVCDDIEMARYAVVSSIIPWGCRGLKSPASPTSPFYFRLPSAPRSHRGRSGTKNCRKSMIFRRNSARIGPYSAIPHQNRLKHIGS